MIGGGTSGGMDPYGMSGGMNGGMGPDGFNGGGNPPTEVSAASANDPAKSDGAHSGDMVAQLRGTMKSS